MDGCLIGSAKVRRRGEGIRESIAVAYVGVLERSGQVSCLDFSGRGSARIVLDYLRNMSYSKIGFDGFKALPVAI